MKTSFFCIILALSTFLVEGQRISFEGISEVKPLKRGKTYQIMWSGGDESDRIELELFRSNTSFGIWEQTVNKGFATVKLPISIKPGAGYYFKITNKGSSTLTTTDTFRIRRKTPLATKITLFTITPLVIVTVLFTVRAEPHNRLPQGPPNPN